MKKIIKSTIPILMITVFNLNLPANTSRDFGKDPELSIKLISKWIIFYTNIERLKNGQPPLQYDPDLEKAALWQAEYCAKTRSLAHIINDKEMGSPKDRIEHFGSRCGACGENLTVNFGANTEGISFYIKKDEEGTYYDYGDRNIYWRNERQMGYSMVEGWMNSPGHRKNILAADFRWIGAGAAKGIYSNTDSYYGCQVFNGNGGLPHDFIKAEYQLSGVEAVRVTEKGDEAYTIKYSGNLIPGVIEVTKDNELISHELEKTEEGFRFIKKEHPKGQLFSALYDKNQDMLYPVIPLK